MTQIGVIETDECYRCGYALRGIADDQACPECGLLAQRSRRVSDELHNTRPRWLRQLSIGTILILWALLAVPIVPAFIDAAESFVQGVSFVQGANLSPYLTLVSLDVIVMLLFVGVLFLTRAEGYPPA